ncbi:MAG: hypothetical protein A3B70_03560 [Deltaproteobacteria bacterium RIFCSPHIGHO2_02_FULL_40_11]|nr:MAG: hypothetical protein A3B70_03560 [Deltaproteobacteria bacterium RIFCSPHIGHO2_02_FULL_40_11]
MSQKLYIRISGVVFFLVGLVHLIRLMFTWQVFVAGAELPGWPSFLALIVAWYLSYAAFSLKS